MEAARHAVWPPRAGILSRVAIFRIARDFPLRRLGVLPTGFCRYLSDPHPAHRDPTRPPSQAVPMGDIWLADLYE